MSVEKLKQRQSKIQEKRKTTSRRDFLMQIASRRPLSFYKSNSFISRYPNNERKPHIISHSLFDETRDSLVWVHIAQWNWFSEIFSNLMSKVELTPTQQMWNNENADYADMILGGKNIYLSTISVYGCEDILYSFATRENTKHVISSNMVFENSEIIFNSKWIIRSSFIFYSTFIIDSSQMWFCTNCIWCHDCIESDNLENKAYCIKNKQYSREEYNTFKNKILSKKETFVQKFAQIPSQWKNVWSKNTTWSFVIHSENVSDWYFSYNINNSRNIMYMWWAGWNEDMYDVFVGWAIQWDNMYGVQWSGNSQHIYSSMIINDSSHIYYSMYLLACSHCLWCIWLKNASYCIFNKQYTKDERYNEVEKIFAQMEKDWQLWEFFPWSMNPFYFNDTAAYLIDSSFTKEEVIAKWYLWRDEPIKVDIPVGSTRVSTADLDQYEWFDSDWIWTIDPDILKKIIIDADGNSYRIIKMEYDFLVKHWLPLPRKHWLERLQKHFVL